MTTANSSPFPRERKLILGVLLILAAASWALLIWQSAAMNSQAMGMGLTMGMSTGLFIAIWVVMMIAMMFPTAAPMILMFSKIYTSKRQQELPFVPTWVFVSAYLVARCFFGTATGLEQFVKVLLVVAIGLVLLGHHDFRSRCLAEPA